MVIVSAKCRMVWGNEDVVGKNVLALVFKKHIEGGVQMSL